MLLAFMAQCLWTADTRKVSDLEYRYIASGLTGAGEKTLNSSPFTGLVAAFPVRFTSVARKIATPQLSAALAVPRPWLLRLPFTIFGVWLGAALWWVARRLFDDDGGYVALALYCTSPAMVIISSNIGPEILLAWSSLGLIYTAIGVSHTLYAPRKKWIPRIFILGLSIGFALATAWWSFTLVLLACGYMIYLAPGCRRKALTVLASASLVGCAVWASNLLVNRQLWIERQAATGAEADTGSFSESDLRLVRPYGWLCVGFSIHCGAHGLWKLAPCALFRQYRPVNYGPVSGPAIQPGSRRPYLERNFRVKFCVHICWRSGGGLPGNTLSAAHCAAFDCMFCTSGRSDRDGAHCLGAKSDVNARRPGL